MHNLRNRSLSLVDCCGLSFVEPSSTLTPSPSQNHSYSPLQGLSKLENSSGTFTTRLLRLFTHRIRISHAGVQKALRPDIRDFSAETEVFLLSSKRNFDLYLFAESHTRDLRWRTEPHSSTNSVTITFTARKTFNFTSASYFQPFKLIVSDSWNLRDDFSSVDDHSINSHSSRAHTR